MIFNLYASDQHEVTPSSMECVQYADDTSLYSHFNDLMVLADFSKAFGVHPGTDDF